MGVPGKAAQVILGPVVAEIVEEQEGVKLLRVVKAEGAVKMDAGAFQRRLGAAGVEYGTDGHLLFLLMISAQYSAGRGKGEGQGRAIAAQDLFSAAQGGAQTQNAPEQGPGRARSFRSAD
jgi:hypothetical protein